MARRVETDLARYDLATATRGKYVEKAHRSLATITLDRKLLNALGGPDAAIGILEAVAKSIAQTKKKRRAA